MEKNYDDLSSIAKKGINKFARLSPKGILKYQEKYQKKTGKSAFNIKNKESFYSFVARNNIR